MTLGGRVLVEDVNATMWGGPSRVGMLGYDNVSASTGPPERQHVHRHHGQHGHLRRHGQDVYLQRSWNPIKKGP
jgi:hypothetical protein